MLELERIFEVALATIQVICLGSDDKFVAELDLGGIFSPCITAENLDIGISWTGVWKPPLPPRNFVTLNKFFIFSEP